MTFRRSRRRFMQSTAALGLGYWVAGGTAVAQQSNSPNERIRFATIGVGGKGRSDSAEASRHGDIVAICDVDEGTLGQAAERFTDAEKFFDFRKMLEVMGDRVDAVTVSIPDHCHAAAAAMAMKMGKHCFVQKPMTHSIYEARRLQEIARETGVATMMGNQGTAYSGLRQAAKLIQDGLLGTVSEVHVWTNRPIWPQGIERPGAQPIPNNVHWYEWLGPAPDRPYNEAYHPFNWRGFWDFGTGALGDMACHTLNMPFMGLDLRDPLSVSAESSGHNGETYPGWSVIEFEFGPRNGRAPLKLVWYDGGKTPPHELPDPPARRGGRRGRGGRGGAGRRSNTGSLVIGDKGKLYSPDDYGQRFIVFDGPETPAEIEIEESPGHFEEWVRAIQGGQPAKSNFVDYAGPLTETILLGNLAVAAGEKVEWDAKSMTPKNKPDLERIVRREPRRGYEV